MSDYLDKLIAQGRESLWDDDGNDWAPDDEPVTQSINTVKHDGFDELSWSMLLDQIGVLNEAVHTLAEDHGTSQEAQEDLFNLLHQTDPLFRDGAEVKPTHRPQRAMLEALAGTDEFVRLRNDTVLDEYATAFSQLCLQEPLREAFDEMSKAAEAQQQAQQALSDAMEQAASGDPGAGDAIEQALGQVEQANQQADATAQEQVQTIADQAHDTQQQMRQESDQLAQYGHGEGDLKQLDYAERRALVEKFNKSRLAKLSKLIGSFRQFADAERRRKVRHAPEERFDVTMGNDLTKLIPSEVNALAIPELEDQFWIRYAQHGLLQWSEDGSERAGQGPIIVVCDESWSMTKKLDRHDNTREEWSKAVSLALADQAQRSGRDFNYIGFGGSGQIWERSFRGGRLTLDDLIEFTEHFFSGGTEYTGPLGRAMEIVDDYAKRGQARPDIVLITDDECKVPDEFTARFLAAKVRTDARCYGIQVGGDKGYGTLKILADHTLSITRLTASPEGVQTLFRTI